MKFLLAAINAKYIHSNPAVYSLKAYAGEAYSDSIEIAEYTINNRLSDIMADIYARKPDAVAFSCYIWNFTMISALLPDLHKILPGIPIWLGGPEVSFEADRILNTFPCLHGIMRGEGEQTFLELLQFYKGEGKKELSDIAGITVRSEDQIRVSPERAPAKLDSLPFLYQDMKAFQNKMIYYESARGCPYRCSYCLSSIDKRVRHRDLALVKEELLFFIREGTAQVKFIDRTFNCSHDHAAAIWRFIQEKDRGITNFHFEIAADILTEEELMILADMRPGLVQLEIGVQSANRDTLRAINRVTDLAKLTRAVKQILSGKNLHVHLDLIAGLPYEGYQSFGASFDFVYGMRPHQLQLGFLKVLKGSPIQEQAAEFGIYYTEKPPYEVLYSKWISYEEICRLKQIEEMVEIYYNSNQFAKTLSVLEGRFKSPFAMYERLASFFVEKGYFVNQPSRAYRYVVLLEFAKECDGERARLYEELLTFDLYAREKLKSRPVFACDQTPYKESVRSFYENRKLVERYLPAFREYEGKQAARMTHMEFFEYRVWEEDAEKQQAVCSGQTAVLFQYEQRDPLTGQAHMTVLTKEEMEGNIRHDKENKGDSGFAG